MTMDPESSDPKTTPTPAPAAPTGTDPGPAPPDGPLLQLLRQLVKTTPELAEQIRTLGRDTGDQFVTLAHWAKANRRLIWALGVSLVLDLVLTFALAWDTVRVDSLTHRIDVAQTTQRQKALCPLYGLFLSSENPKSRAAYPEGPAAYDRAFGVIKQGYNALDCTSYLTPTRTPTH
jgi:hypothetical protein